MAFDNEAQLRARVERSDPGGPGAEHHIGTRDFEPVAMQHEVDHLNGILFVDRVSNLATDIFPCKHKA